MADKNILVPVVSDKIKETIISGQAIPLDREHTPVSIVPNSEDVLIFHIVSINHTSVNFDVEISLKYKDSDNNICLATFTVRKTEILTDACKLTTQSISVIEKPTTFAAAVHDGVITLSFTAQISYTSCQDEIIKVTVVP